MPPAPVSIKFLSGPLAGQTFPIRKPEATIGRESSNDIVIKHDLKVSRRHIRLLWQNDTWTIENLSQTSPLTVNQQQVQHALLTDNALIGLGGDTTFVFLVQASTPDPQDVMPP